MQLQLDLPQIGKENIGKKLPLKLEGKTIGTALIRENTAIITIANEHRELINKIMGQGKASYSVGFDVEFPPTDNM